MKPPGNQIGILLVAAGLLAVASVATAQTTQTNSTPANQPKPPANLNTGQVTKGFTLPQYQNGKLTAMINGAEARTISVNRTEIIDLKVDLYEADTVSTTITSPKSDYWTADNKMRTRFGVVITRADMVISAQTMEWEIKEQRGVLRQDVKVVLNSLDLTKPAETPSPQATAPMNAPIVSPTAAPLTDTPSLMLQPGTTASDSSPLTTPPAPQ